MNNALLALLPVLLVSPALAQKLAVKIVDRQNHEAEYTYVVPERSTSRSNTNVNCVGGDATVDCKAATTTTTSSTPAQHVSYRVRGATFALQLPDGRVAVVNCESKYAPLHSWAAALASQDDSSLSTGNQRSCRIPLANNIDAEFNGNRAKLEWPVSIDGKKMESETYKVLGVLPK